MTIGKLKKITSQFNEKENNLKIYISPQKYGTRNTLSKLISVCGFNDEHYILMQFQPEGKNVKIPDGVYSQKELKKRNSDDIVPKGSSIRTQKGENFKSQEDQIVYDVLRMFGPALLEIAIDERFV
jgi:hypothetical protein